MFTENYSEAISTRLNWVDDEPEGEIYGEVTYVGNYCVVTGLTDPYFRDERVSVLYWVGNGSVAGPERENVKLLEMSEYKAAKAAHEALVMEAYDHDYVDYVVGE